MATLCTGEAVGSTWQSLGSSGWQSLKGRKQLGRMGVPPAARATQPPLFQQGERGSLLQGWDAGMCPPPHSRGTRGAQ